VAGAAANSFQEGKRLDLLTFSSKDKHVILFTLLNSSASTGIS
jgi:hypothetical protein